MCLKSVATFVLITLISVFCASLSAQDIIVKTDATIIRAVINEIDDNTILYHQWENQSGPAFRIRLDQVSRIQFQNGTEQVFSNLKQDVNASPMSLQNLARYGKLEYIGHGDFTLGGRQLNWQDDSLFEELFGYSGYYHTYMSAQKQRRAGKTLIPIGGGVMGVGLLCVFLSAPSSMADIGSILSPAFLISTALIAAGGTLISIGVPLLIIGNSRLRWIADDFNKNLGYKASLTVGPTQNGFGISLIF